MYYTFSEFATDRFSCQFLIQYTEADTTLAHVFLFCCNAHENKLISTNNDVLLAASSNVCHRKGVELVWSCFGRGLEEGSEYRQEIE